MYKKNKKSTTGCGVSGFFVSQKNVIPKIHGFSWGFACRKLSLFLRLDFWSNARRSQAESAGREKLGESSQKLCGSVRRFFPCGYITYRRRNPLLCKLLTCMCGGAVNRQPGYRARDLQRRGFYKEETKKKKKNEKKSKKNRKKSGPKYFRLPEKNDI